MEKSGYLDEINACYCLFLQEVDEPWANALKLVLTEGRLSKIPTAIEVAGQSLGEGYPVEIDETCSTFELTWDSYVRYQVTNESFGISELSGDEQQLREKVRRYEKSSLLEHAMSSTTASDEYPGKLLHFQILCADHLIDVISTSAPNCRRTNPKVKVH
jgi:hypothetical protein